jgi:hypothetical protein
MKRKDTNEECFFMVVLFFTIGTTSLLPIKTLPPTNAEPDQNTEQQKDTILTEEPAQDEGFFSKLKRKATAVKDYLGEKTDEAQEFVS